MIVVPIEALEMHRFVSKDQERKNLHYLEFRKWDSASDVWVASATDGHMLGTFSWTHTYDGPPFYIKGEDVFRLLKRATKKERMGGAILDPINDTVSIGTMGTVPLEALTDAQVSFPPVEDVLPKDNTVAEACTIGMDLFHIHRIYSWAQAVNRRAWVSMMATGEMNPLYLEADLKEEGTARFAVMPCRF